MARTTFNIARGEAAAIQTLGFSVVQPANTRPLSYSSVNMAQQFAQVWNAAIAGSAPATDQNVALVVHRNGTVVASPILTPATGQALGNIGTVTTSTNITMTNLQTISGAGTRNFVGGAEHDADRIEIRLGDENGAVIGTFVPTPIRQLLKIRGGKAAGGGIGGGRGGHRQPR